MVNLRVVLFISRNKDNRGIKEFKERKVSFLTDKSVNELRQDFHYFMKRGQPDETCRFYISVNKRDGDKIRKGLIQYLVDHEEINMSHIDRRVASIASLKENAKEKKWLFDFDEDNYLINDFVQGIKGILPSNVEVIPHKTPNGYAVIVGRGFDTRELLSKWKNVELKRDDMLCVDWSTNVYE